MANCRLNYFICENSVYIEGERVMNFISFSSINTRSKLAEEGEMKIPLYSIAKLNNKGEIITGRNLIDLDAYNIKVGAYIKITAKYKDIMNVQFPECVVFEGFIKQIISGSPTTIILEDKCFILRFGSITKEWTQATKIIEGLKFCCDVGNKSFLEFRKSKGLTKDFPELKVSEETADSVYNMKVWKGVSPFQIVNRLMRDYSIYTGITYTGELYMGTGLNFPQKATQKLSTKVNVLERDIKPENGMFEDYYVIVNGFDKNGKRIKATAGDREGSSQVISLGYTPINTQEGLQQLATNKWYSLKSENNSGTITTTLYPDIHLFDYVSYEDTLFSELSNNFYIIGTRLSLGNNGYRRILSVTDKRFEW